MVTWETDLKSQAEIKDMQRVAALKNWATHQALPRAERIKSLRVIELLKEIQDLQKEIGCNGVGSGSHRSSPSRINFKLSSGDFAYLSDIAPEMRMGCGCWVGIDFELQVDKDWERAEYPPKHSHDVQVTVEFDDGTRGVHVGHFDKQWVAPARVIAWRSFDEPFLGN
jgi:hypothetical protein